MTTSDQHEHERDLIAIIAANNGRKRDEAIAELFEAYAPLFNRYFQRQTGNQADADDLAQETFVKIVRGAGTYQGEANVSAWIWSIARNTLYSAYRSAARKSVEQTGIDPDSLIADSNETEESRSLRDCVRQEFSAFAVEHPERAQALALTVYYGWKPQDIAAFLERTAAATREYLSQCRKLLKKYVDKCREYLEQ